MPAITRVALVLMREPANPADTNAIICCDIDGISIGYVARTAAAVVAPDMDRGLHWRGKITGRRIVALREQICVCHHHALA